MQRRAFLSRAAAVCLALGGCGPARSYKYQIAVIPKGLTHEHWQSVHRGAERAAADLTERGIATAVLYDGPRKESDALEQINLINVKAGMGIQGLVLAPQDSKQMVAPVERVVARGIPVVIIDSGLDPAALEANPELIVKYVATNNYRGGQMGARRLLEVVKGVDNPRLILFRYQPGSESTEQREQGFLDQLEEERKKGRSFTLISSDKYAGATVDTAQREAGPLLTQFRKEGIDGIFAVNESATSGMLNALRSQQLNRQVHLVGFDSSAPLQEALKEGDVEGLVVQDPYFMGFMGVWDLVMYLEGRDVAARGKNLDTGEYLMTKENLHDNDIRKLFDVGVQADREITPPEYPQRS